MTDLRSCPDCGQLADLLAGSLSPALQESVARHVEACADCQSALEALAATSWDERARHLGEGLAATGLVLKEVMRKALGVTTATGGEASPASEEDLSFLDPPREAGNLGRLGHYEVLELLGRGGFGLVFKAHDDNLDRIVAIKVMAPALAASVTARKRFVREAKAAAAVRDDHVIGIHEVDEAAPIPFLVMEFVAGQSLQEKLDRSGPLAVPEVLRIAIQVARGLAAAHAQGLVHRDVKPGNILLENGVERVKITDFGLARAIDDASLTQSGVVAGTPMYMSPEQAAGEAVDHRADLFSLGTVLYAMCTGRPPFRATGAMAVLKRVCDESPRPIREVNPEVPDWLCAVIEKLHAKRPEHRFQSAREVADLLAQHLAHLQQPESNPLPPPVQAPPSLKRREPVTLLGIAVPAWFCVFLLLLPLAMAVIDDVTSVPGALAEYTGVVLAAVAGLGLLLLIVAAVIDWQRHRSLAWTLGKRPWVAALLLACLVATNATVLSVWADPWGRFHELSPSRPVERSRP